MTIEKPILFSGPMVRAILEGRKTQTRRVVKPQPEAVHVKTACSYAALLRFAPYSGGMRLWVREAWATAGPAREYCRYRADDKTNWLGAWKPSIHMPRWASRITLEVTGVRVERLQNISDSDCDAEGTTDHYICTEPTHETDGIHRCHPQRDYQQMWDSINAKRGFPWSSNPVVWVIEFQRK